jgi:hypothetical protein
VKEKKRENIIYSMNSNTKGNHSLVFHFVIRNGKLNSHTVRRGGVFIVFSSLLQGDMQRHGPEKLKNI